MVPTIGEHIWTGGAKRRVEHYPSSSGFMLGTDGGRQPRYLNGKLLIALGLNTSKGDMGAWWGGCRGMSLAKGPAREHHSARLWRLPCAMGSCSSPPFCS